MLDRVSGVVARGVSVSICHTLDHHAPDATNKSNGLFLYSRCRFCGIVITRSGANRWRAAVAVDDAYLSEMKDV